VQNWTPSVDIFEIEVYKSIEQVVWWKGMIGSREFCRILLYVQTRRFKGRLGSAIEFRCLPGLHCLSVVVVLLLLLHTLLKDVAMD